MGNNKEKKALYLMHSIELLVWLVIVLIIVATFTITNVAKNRNDNDYTIFMDDVDGLIVGSPVRMMGIEVGHITKIKPTNEEVYIKFIISDEKMVLPLGTVATVEFSGMAGSKSLELYLPDKSTYIDENTPIVKVEPPKRLHDAAGLLNEMFDKIGSIMFTSSSFGKKLKDTELPAATGGNMNEFMDYANKMIDDSEAKANDLNKKLKSFSNGKEDKNVRK